ncbi:hypothetical protein B0T17DRAFT_485659 [Bombardia bombarda]|uniref:Inactive metallocarboxypeptidase ECM14 n=1 Tax=Bombardia bombarda TaxID=252184 RepID=A0AA39XK78_9PEZI|nr:hypothetical protein B0T17DRAFT_485659 [Bombardia bombarda]
MPPYIRNLIAIALSVVLVLALLSPAVDAAGIRPSWHQGRNHDRHHAPDGRHTTTLWTRLRESATELLFGRPPVAKSNILLPNAAQKSQYGKDVVLRFNVTNSDEEAALASATDQLLFLDVWAFTREFVDIRLDKEYVPSLIKLLPSSLEPSVLIPDVGAAVLATYPSKVGLGPNFDSSTPESASFEEIFNSNKFDPDRMQKMIDGVDHIFFSDYQPLSVISNWMHLLQTMFPAITELKTIGQSFEGRPIEALRIGERNTDKIENGPRKTILVTGGLHGREWISTSTVNYLLWSVLTTFGNEPLMTKLLQRFDIVFVPVLNPDGYDYTWETDRLWRKSRQQTKHFCRGLDLDHAFGFEWDAAKHRTDPCSQSYGGDEPFQAIEASELANWAKNETEHNVKFVGFLDLHSYSQQILIPYSYTCLVDPPNRENLEELAIGLAKSIRLSSGEQYSVASACEGAIASSDDDDDVDSASPHIESGGGSAIDWFYHELQARYSYQIKLRDTGSYGFLLPRENIIPTGEEMLNAFKYFGDFLLGNNGIEKSYESVSAKNSKSFGDAQWSDLKRRKR